MKKSSDLNLLNKTLELYFTGTFETFNLSFVISITYYSNGPRFVPTADKSTDSLSKEVIKAGFSYQVPPVVADTQQNVQVSLDQSSPVSSIFNFDPNTFELTIRPEIQASLAAGSMRLEPGTY